MSVGYEIHWFIPHAMPESVTIWFDRITKEWLQGAQKLDSSLTEVEKPRPKTDLYLIPRGREDMALKMKDGKLELFVREKEGQPIASTHEKIPFTGLLETWVRWRWRHGEDAQEQIDQAFTVTNRDRLLVTRTRREVKYEVEASERLIPIPLGPTESPAVSLELVQMKVQDQADWWAIDIEFSTPKVTPIMVEQLLRFYGGPKLAVTSSFGYPKWLALVYKMIGSSQSTTVMRRGER